MNGKYAVKDLNFFQFLAQYFIFATDIIIGHIAPDDEEFVTADAVTTTGSVNTTDSFGNRCQDNIAARMTVRIIKYFKVIDIDDHDKNMLIQQVLFVDGKAAPIAK